MKRLTLHSEAYRYIIAGFREWLQTLGCSEQTVYQLPNYVQELLHYAETKGYAGLHQINNELLKEHYYKLRERSNKVSGGGLSAAYLNKHQQGLYKFSDYLRQSGRLMLPMLDIRCEEDHSEVTDVLTQEEIKQLYAVTHQAYEPCKQDKGIVFYEAMQLRDRAMLTIFYGCGLRRNEAVYLNITDINLDAKYIRVRKGKNYQERIVPVTTSSMQHLQQYVYDGRPYFICEKTDAFFISYTGKRLGGQQLLLRLKLLIQLTGNAALQQKDIHLHTLRHSIATHLLQNGMRLERIKEFLGHSSLDSTQLYAHLTDNQNNII